MSFFDRFRDESAETQSSLEQTINMNTELFRDLTQEISVCMFQFGFINKPAMRFFRDDKNFLYSFAYHHINGKQFVELRKKSVEGYLYVAGMHAYGAGIYVTAMQSVFEHSVDDFTNEEFEQILLNCGKKDVYELAFEAINVSIDSNLRKKCDAFLTYSLRVYLTLTKDKSVEPENIYAFMQVLYNAGITSLLRV